MQRRRVVVIDDDDAVRRALVRGLRLHHDVVDYATADAALAALTSEEVVVDVILCDLAMPGTDGAQLRERLLGVRPALAARMIFATGGATTDEHARLLDVVRCVHKPITVAALLQVIDEVAALS